MYEFLRQKAREPFQARYFKQEPSLPLTEAGELFKYREAPRWESMDNVITNLKGINSQKNIETTSPIQFAPDAYIAIGDDLWRINTVTVTPRSVMAAGISRRTPSTTTLQLQLVTNPVGVRA